jgi:hypothetical protein
VWGEQVMRQEGVKRPQTKTAATGHPEKQLCIEALTGGPLQRYGRSHDPSRANFCEYFVKEFFARVFSSSLSQSKLFKSHMRLRTCHSSKKNMGSTTLA